MRPAAILLVASLACIPILPIAHAGSVSGEACTLGMADAGVNCATGTIANDDPICGYSEGDQWTCTIKWTLSVTVKGVDACGRGTASVGITVDEFCTVVGIGMRPRTLEVTYTPAGVGEVASANGEVCASTEGMLEHCNPIPRVTVPLPAPPPRTGNADADTSIRVMVNLLQATLYALAIGEASVLEDIVIDDEFLP